MSLPPVSSISLPLVSNDDNELTCISCHLRKCEYAIEVLGDNHSWMGIHERCVKVVNERTTKWAWEKTIDLVTLSMVAATEWTGED